MERNPRGEVSLGRRSVPTHAYVMITVPAHTMYTYTWRGVFVNRKVYILYSYNIYKYILYIR